MKVEAHYIENDCILLEIEDKLFSIMINCPSLKSVETLEVDWSAVDFILLSNYKSCLCIPFITQYTKFKGLVFATEPTVAFSRLLCQEHVYSNKDELPLIFNLFDIEECHRRIKPIFFNAPIQITSNLSIHSCCSGALLGGSNWLVKYGSIDIAYVGEVLKNAHPNYRSFDVPVLMGKDLLIIPSPVNVRKPIYNKRLVDLWPTLEKYLKNKGTILFPTSNVDEMFMIVEELYQILDSVGIQRPIHILSKTGKQAILQSSIFSEWMSKPKQELSLNARVPLLAAALVDKRHVLCHESIKEALSYAEPRLIICTREFDLIDMFHSLSNACVILSDNSFKVPEHSVYYYDSNQLDVYQHKELINLLKPLNFFLTSDQVYFSLDWKCTVPHDILEKTLHGQEEQMFLPFIGELDLRSNALR